MPRPNRLLSLLQLFENDRSIWTVDEMGAALKVPTSTVYRHVRELVRFGFLDPVVGAGYSLGPAFIRYDRILRQKDELIHVAEPIMRDLLDQTSQRATVIISRRFKDCVMCVHQVRGKQPHPPTRYERGVAMPLFIGATSKIILANLPDRMLKSVYLDNEKTIRKVLKLDNWKEFKAQFREIRQAGYVLTDSEIAAGRIGVAAPILRGDQLVAGISLMSVPNNAADRVKLKGFIPHIVDAAGKISKLIAKKSTLVPR